MNPSGKWILAAWALLMAVGLARAADPAESAYYQQDDDAAATAGDSDTGPTTAPTCTMPCAGAPLPVFVPQLTPGFQYTAGFLLLKPGADNLGWSTITTYLPVQNPQWDVQNLNPAYQPGFTVGARYVGPSSGRDIQTNWEHLRTSDSSFVPVSDPTTQWISPFNQTGPSTSEFFNEIGVFYLKSAQAQVNFAYDMVNLDVGQSVNFGPNSQLRLFAGVSWVRLQEQLISTFYNNTSITPQSNPSSPAFAIPDPSLQYITLNNTSTYTGAGPRFGFTATQNLSPGLTFVGQLSGAVFAGSQQPAQYVFQGVFDDKVDREQISSRPATQVVYATDAKLGLGYNRLLSKCAVLNIESGFKAAIFINPFSTYETSTNVLPLNIGSLSTNSMRHTPSNFTLNGWYASASVQW